MPLNFDVDTSNMERLDQPPVTVRIAPPFDTTIHTSPSYQTSLPMTAIVNPDAVRNSYRIGLPVHRLIPPQPLNLAAANSVPAASPANVAVPQPPAPTIAQPLTTTPVGFQFSFRQVVIPASVPAATAINSYKVYRNTSNATGSAGVIQSFPHHPSNTGTPVVVQDAQPVGAVMFYWVSTVNESGLESPLVSAQTGSVVSGSQLTSAGQLVTADQIAADGTSFFRTPYVTAPLVDDGIYNGSFEYFPTSQTVADGWTKDFQTSGGTGLQYVRSTTANVGSFSQGITNGIQIDSDTFAGSSLSSNWTVTQGSFIVSSGHVTAPTSSAAFCAAAYTGASVGANQYAQITVNNYAGAGSADGTIGVCVRASSSAVTYYAAYQDNANSELFIYKFVAGVETVLASVPRVGSNGDVILLVATGTTISLYVNGVFQTSVSDSSISSGSPGIVGLGSTTGTMQQGSAWSGGNFVGTSVASRPFSVKQNLNYQFELYAQSTVANPGTLYARIWWYSASGDFSATSAHLITTTDLVSAGGPTAANTWQSFSGEFLAPATAKFARVGFFNWIGTINTMLLDGVAFGIGTFNPAQGVLASQGSIPPTTNGSMSYTSDTADITWSWSGLTVYRSDNTTTSIPNSNRTTSSLSSATTYYFYPYYDDLLAALHFVNGASGSTGEAFTAAQRSNTAVQQQTLNARIALSTGSMSAATTASGSGGGGSGGGGGSCVRHTMLVEEKTKGVIPAHEVVVGDWLRTVNGWTKVVFAKLMNHDYFVRLKVDGEFIEVTPIHPFNGMDENCCELVVRAAKATLMHQLYTTRGAAFIESISLVNDKDGKKMVIGCEDVHTFFAGETRPHILAHNNMPDQT